RDSAFVTLAEEVEHRKRERPGKPPAVCQGLVNLDDGEQRVEDYRRQQPQRRQSSNPETRSPGELTADQRSRGEECEARARVEAIRNAALDFRESAEQPPQQPPEKQHRRESLFVLREALAKLKQDGCTEYRGGADQHTAQANAVEYGQCLLQRVAVGPEDRAASDLQQGAECARQAPALAASDPHQPGALHRPRCG